jgi:membrane-bound lytic murein transglycosylase B
MTKLLFAVAVCLALPFGASAGAVDQSLRPKPRPVAALDRAVFLPGNSLRPRARPAVATTRDTGIAPTQVSASDPAFQRWIKGFRGRALKAGISAGVFDRAFRGVTYDEEVIRRDRNQSEFNKPIWEYLDFAASDSRVSNGRGALRTHRRLLDRIEAKYGVEKEVVVAVWGMESAYGARRGDMNLIRSLATLSHDGRRGSFFEKQLIAALKILQNGDITPERMTGSWAGAMGHTQFIPTSYLAYAVDFTGDGKRDIWSDDPADALASTAAYLSRHGWKRGVPWGTQVRLPRNFDYSTARKTLTRMPSEWARLGVMGLDGKPVRDYGQASVMLPAGAQGPAFLVFSNFKVISRYNASDAYVMGVGHLSDRVGGGGPIQGDWPRDDRPLTFAERKEMQQLLTRAGHDTKGIDGKVGPATVSAIMGYQRSVGMPADGNPSFTLLKRLRR